jgi:hypothetical protein
MGRNSFVHPCAALLSGLALAACNRSEPTQPAVPPPQVTAPASAPIPAQPSTGANLPAAPEVKPAAGPAAAQPASASSAKPHAEPDLASMKLAKPASSKIGVPVDLRYEVEGDALSGAPAILHLAAVPRVAGTNLKMSVKEDPGIEASKQPLSAEKVSAATPYRQQLSIRRLPSGPAEVQVLVTMDFPIGTGFSYFSVPLQGTPATKQRADRTE